MYDARVKGEEGRVKREEGRVKGEEGREKREEGRGKDHRETGWQLVVMIQVRRSGTWMIRRDCFA